MSAICSLCGEPHSILITVAYPTSERVRMWSPEQGSYVATIERPGGKLRFCPACWRGDWPRTSVSVSTEGTVLAAHDLVRMAKATLKR